MGRASRDEWRTIGEKKRLLFSVVAIPLYVRHNILLKNGSAGRFELTVGPKQSMGKMLEDVMVECQMPKGQLCWKRSNGG